MAASRKFLSPGAYMSFKDVLGQEKPIAILQKALINDRLSHAYLFYGPSGAGKVFTALNFAKALNCLNRPDNKADSCDECASCKKIESGNHIDVRWIGLLKGKSDISIEQIRQIQAQVNLRPYEAQYKIFCVQDAEYMNEEAQNALLKTLEEPPPKSIIILTTSSPGALLGTILSRCQLIKFFPLSIESSRDILIKHFNIEQDAAYFLAHIAQSGLVSTTKFSEAGILEEKNKIIDSFGNFLKNPSVELSFLKESNDNIQWILSVLLWWYRDMLIYKETGDSSGLANKDRLNDLSALAARHSSLELGDIINTISRTAQLLNETNVSAKLALTVMATDILNEVKNVSGNSG